MIKEKMSTTVNLLPNYRLGGHNLLPPATLLSLSGAGSMGGLSRWSYPYAASTFFPNAGEWPAVAESYSPAYESPQTKYGQCDCMGSAIRINNCNFQQGGYRPQCLLNQNCRCTSPDGSDFGCFNRPGGNCM